MLPNVICRVALVVGLSVVVLAGAQPSYSQGFQGGLRGSIRDAGGGVPGAAVTLTNENTNLARATITNGQGEYAFAALEPGSYRVKVTLTGFKTIERAAVRIGTQSFLILDLGLEVGSIEESITVSGQTPLIETANASHGTVLDRTMLETLPAPGRAAFLMAVSIPTVVASGDGQFNRQQDQSNASFLSLGGGPRRGNNYTIDGVAITDILNRAVANPTMEALDDVKVQVHTYDAEMGRTGGGVFNTTMRSGTNMFRGTAFFQTRPLWGQENNYFSELAGRPKPESVYYLGGGGVGGPIIRDKTFFFFAAENYHDVQSRSVSTAFPTAAERAGDFSRLTNSAGQPVTIYDPLTRQPFPGNVIPANRINAVAAAIAGYLPLPDVDVDNGTNNYTRTAEIINNFQQEYTFKGEHKFNDRVALTGFYLYNRTDEPDADYFEVGLNGATRFADPNDYLLKRRPQILALNNTWVLSNDSVLALRYGWTRFVDNNTMTIDFDPATLGFSQTFLDQVEQTGGPKFPNGSMTGYSSFGAITPSFRTYKSWNLNASYSKLVGRHTLKFGADYRKLGVYLLNPGDSSGRFSFDKEFTSATGLNNSSTDRRQRVRQLPPRLPVGQRRAPEHHDPDDAPRYLHELLRRLRAGRLAGQLAADAELRPPPRARRRHARSRQQLHRWVRPRGVEHAQHRDDPGRSDRRHAGAPGRRRADVCRRGRQQDRAGQPARPQVVAPPGRRLLAQALDGAARRLWALLGAVELPRAEQRQQQLRPARVHAEHGLAADGGDADGFADQSVSDRPRQPAREQLGRPSPVSARQSAMWTRTVRRHACSSIPPEFSRSCPPTWRSR